MKNTKERKKKYTNLDKKRNSNGFKIEGYTHTNIHTLTHTHTNIHTLTHTHKHTHTHTHIQICIPSLFSPLSLIIHTEMTHLHTTQLDRRSLGRHFTFLIYL